MSEMPRPSEALPRVLPPSYSPPRLEHGQTLLLQEPADLREARAPVLSASSETRPLGSSAMTINTGDPVRVGTVEIPLSTAAEWVRRYTDEARNPTSPRP